eukprot:scaffold3054_cov129-Cylindrotheca_fusiformis.AAC.21
MTTCFRLILEFELFKKRKRESAGVTVVALMTGGALTTLSHVNTPGSTWPGVWEMTRDIVVLVWKEIRTDRDPLQFASIGFIAVGIASLFYFLLPGVDQDKPVKNDRFV